jgi:hypothetical protein
VDVVVDVDEDEVDDVVAGAGCANTPPASAAVSVRIRIVRVARVMVRSISFAA